MSTFHWSAENIERGDSFCSDKEEVQWGVYIMHFPFGEDIIVVRACPLWPKVVHFSLERRALTERGNTPLKNVIIIYLKVD